MSWTKCCYIKISRPLCNCMFKIFWITVHVRQGVYWLETDVNVNCLNANLLSTIKVILVPRTLQTDYRQTHWHTSTSSMSCSIGVAAMLSVSAWKIYIGKKMSISLNFMVFCNLSLNVNWSSSKSKV